MRLLHLLALLLLVSSFQPPVALKSSRVRGNVVAFFGGSSNSAGLPKIYDGWFVKGGESEILKG